MQVKKKGQTCAEGLKINPFAQVCPQLFDAYKSDSFESSSYFRFIAVIIIYFLKKYKL